MTESDLDQLLSPQWSLRVWLSLAVGLALCVTLVYLAQVWQRADDPLTAMAQGQYARAAELYRIAAANGDGAALTALGNLYYLGIGVDRDYRQALAWYYRAAREQQLPAIINLGHLYREGLGVQQDAMRAYAWYRIAERRGSTVAHNYASMMASEWALSPMMMSTAAARWPKLESLLADQNN